MYLSVYHSQSIHPAQRSHLVTASKHTGVSKEGGGGDRWRPRICVDSDRYKVEGLVQGGSKA